MKNSIAVAIAILTLPVTAFAQFATVQECRADNTKVLAEVDAQYKLAKLTKAQQDEYDKLRRSAVSRDAIAERRGNELGACEGQSRRIASLQKGLTAMMPQAAKVGDRARGGIIFYVTDFGQHGLVAWTEDCNTKLGRITWQAATSECSGAKGGFSDWYLPSSEELSYMFRQKAVVPGLKNDTYWSSTKLTFGPLKDWDSQVFWVSMADGGSNWSYVNKDGLNRALHNSRSIRKF